MVATSDGDEPLNMFNNGNAYSSKSSSVQQSTEQVDLDSLTYDELKVQAHNLAHRYKLLLEQCDVENASMKELRKRLKNLESEKVSFSSKYTDEICDLLSENTVLKSKLERMEACKQQIEFQSVSKLQKLAADATTKDEQINILESGLSNLRDELSSEVASKKELEQELKTFRCDWEEKEGNYKGKIDCLISENSSLQSEKNALTHKINEQNNTISTLQHKIDGLSKDCKSMERELKYTKQEFETFVTCSDEKRSEMLSRNEELENALMKESSEKNRLADKTEKITTQLTDLIRTYENTKHESNQLSSRLQQLCDEKLSLEKSLEESVIECEKLKSELVDYEQNFTSIRYELEQALKRQQVFENTYSDSFKDLEAVLFHHANGIKNVDVNHNNPKSGGASNAKNDYSSAAGGRRTLERAESRNRKQKQQRFSNASGNDSCSRFESSLPTKDKEGLEDGNVLLQPSQLVRSVGSLMQQYSSQIEASRTENAALIDRLKAVNAEIGSYKEAIDHSKTILDELKEQLATKSHELTKSRREKAELDEKLKRTLRELNEMTECHEKQKSRADKLSDQMLVMKKKAKIDDETKKKQMLLMRSKMLSSKVLSEDAPKSSARSSSSHVDTATSYSEGALNEFSEWELINEQVLAQLDALLKSHKSMIEKLRSLEFACVSKDETIDELNSKHDSELNSFKSQMALQSQTFTNQKIQLEEHYQTMMKDLQNKLKDQQIWNQESNEKVIVLENLRTSQEIEIGELKELLLKSQNNGQSFQLALSLLCSILWPVFGRLNSLISQQCTMNHYYQQAQQTNHHVSKLVAALNNHMDPNDEALSSHGHCNSRGGVVKLHHPILRFRKCVIVVLAANRLMRILNESSLCFTVDDVTGGPNCRLSVYIGHCSNSSNTSSSNGSSRFESTYGGSEQMKQQSGNLKKSKSKNSSKCASSWRNVEHLHLKDPKEKIQKQQSEMLNWLTDSGFSYKVVTSMNDLLYFIQTNSVDSEVKEKQLKGILTQTRNCFIQLISRVSHHFQDFSPLVDYTNAVREPTSLSQRLLRGLHATMIKLHPSQRAVYAPVEHNLSAVQSALIDLCEKVANYENEKASFNQEIAHLRSENNNLAHVKDRASILQAKLDSLKQQSESMISKEKYNKICGELENALLREKQAEDLLREQGDQLLSLGKQLEAKHREESSREMSLAESAREMCETKLELSKKSHEMRGLSRKLEEMQLEKARLQQSMTNADISARCAVRDGDILSCYVKTVNNAVENFKNQLIYSPSTVNTLTLPQLEEVLSGDAKVSNELKICTELVENFGEALGHLTTHLHNQTNQIRTQKNNIAALKQEFLASTKPPLPNSASANNNSFFYKQPKPFTLSSTPDSDYGGSSSATLMALDPGFANDSDCSSPLPFAIASHQNPPPAPQSSRNQSRNEDVNTSKRVINKDQLKITNKRFPSTSNNKTASPGRTGVGKASGVASKRR